MQPDIITAILFIAGLLTAVIAVGILVVRATVRRTAGAGCRSIAVGLIAAFATALVVFVLVYLRAWAEMGQQISFADAGPPGLSIMEGDFIQMRQALSEYAGQHGGHFPDSLDQVPELKKFRNLDAWDHPYQYTKTANGFKLLSLGRDGKPGGEGLDADIDSEQNPIRLQPTLSQFLFEAAGRRTLLNVAIMASLFAGLACYIASGPGKEGPMRTVDFLSLIAATIVGAVIVSLALVSIYLMGDHH